MEEHAYIVQTLSSFCYLIAGVRLARLARRTRQSAEALLAALFLVTGTSYLVYEIPNLIDGATAWVALNFDFAGRLLYIPAPILLAVFTRRVFRPRASWAHALVMGTVVLMFAGVGFSALGGDLAGYSIDNPWFWCEWVGYTVPFAWAGVEAFLQYRPARLRRAIGLCDPLVCNRFALWALFGLVQVVVSFAALPQYLEYQAENHFGQFWDGVVGGLEIVSVGLIWLAFMPPRAYRHWIGASATEVGSSAPAGSQ